MFEDTYLGSAPIGGRRLVPVLRGVGAHGGGFPAVRGGVEGGLGGVEGGLPTQGPSVVGGHAVLRNIYIHTYRFMKSGTLKNI